MIFYVLLTHGPKPSGSICTHPAAKAQLKFIKRAVSSHPDMKVDVTFDYVRRIDRFDSLPNLKQVLVAVSDVDGVKVRVDDLSRIFRITDLNARQDLLAILQEFGTSLYSIKHNKTLADFSTDQIHNLVLHPEKSKLPAQQNRNGDTTKARASSLRSRTGRSLLVAHQLQNIKNELMDSEGRATLQMVADEANTRGMTTTRGSEWTPQNVARMLKLLE